MPKSAGRPKILLSISDSALLARCQVVLSELARQDAKLDLHVRAVPTLTATLLREGELVISDLPREHFARDMATGGIGWIMLGEDERADVALPRDFQPRELKVAVRLLEELVRLRRESQKQEDERQRFEDLAHRDALTDLPNRRAWDLHGVSLLSAPSGSRCLVMLDIDHFKAFNDQQGHAGGDDVLKKIAAALKKAIRHEDFAARLGGDEFGIDLAEVKPSQASLVVERIRSFLRQESPGLVTVSAGYAVYDPEVADWDSVIAAADEQLLAAKKFGRDRTLGTQVEA